MAVPTGINAEENKAPSGGKRSRLARLVQAWEELDDQIKAIGRGEQPNPTQGSGSSVSRESRLREQRRDLSERIQDLVAKNPELADAAIDFGYNPSLLRTEPLQGPPGAGNPDRAAQDERRAKREADARDDDKPPPTRPPRDDGGDDGGGTGRRNMLDDFKLVRLPSGRVVAVRTLNIKGNKVQWGVHVSEKDFDTYGVNEKNIRSITKAQAKKIEVMGNANEMPKTRGRDPFKDIIKGITRAHKGSPLLDNDEVLGIFIAQSALNLTDHETQGMLKQTKWYKRSTQHEQIWNLDYGPEERREAIRNMKVRLIDELEDLYGIDWQKHIDNPMKQVREWARGIASGEIGGDPGEGLNRWLRNQFDRAAEIQDTPAWMQQQREEEDRRAYLNRPEDIFEAKRAESMEYLGYDKNNTPRLARETLQKWAGWLATGKRSEGDWQQFLRDTAKNLHPYFDPNRSYMDQASPYKSLLESTLGDTVDWNHPLLINFAKTDDKGKATGEALSLYDYGLMVRDPDRNPDAYQQGTPLFDKGADRLAQVLQQLKGVA